MFNDWSIWDYISFSEIIFIFAMPIYYFIITHDSIHIFALLGIQGTNIVVELLKRFVFYDWKRPQNATRCDLLNMSKYDGNMPGMPSGHSATIAFYGAFYGITSPLFYSYVVLIGMSRYFKNCHTIMQIIMGLVLGGALGYGGRSALNKLLK
jgi:membrane-associated phospholipid phosphatase